VSLLILLREIFVVLSKVTLFTHLCFLRLTPPYLLHRDALHLEMNVLWCKKMQITCRTTAKVLVKMLEETGTNISISTVKRVLYPHNLKGQSARKKPLLQNRHKKARLRFATAHGDKHCTFRRNVLWSDEAKIELFGYNDHRSVWREKGEACKLKNTIPTMKHGGGSIMLWGCFAAGMSGVLHKIDRITREENYVDVLKQHFKASVRKLKLGSQMGLPNGQ
jgi:hypothetical protein